MNTKPANFLLRSFARVSLIPVIAVIPVIPVIAVIVLIALLPLTTTARATGATGQVQARLAPFDELIESLLRKYDVPGAALAVVKDGRLVVARGYGLADKEQRQAVQPDSLFRIASLSKPFTSAAILTLVERGRLRLDDRAFPLLALGEPSDPRLNTITIRELLLHAGGWDRDASFDPMFIPFKAARAVGAKPPASCETIIRYMLKQPLQFDPGSAMHYSNFGYCVLGRVIEKVSGEPYETYVRSAVLAPIGITRMRIGHTVSDERAPGEVRYSDFAGAPQVPSVFPSRPGQTARPYGGFYLEAMDSHGGWIASAIDLVRFMAHLDGTLKPAPLKPATVADMLARPDPRLVTERETWYAFGWQVREVGRDANWWHTGSLSGTATLMVRTSQGMQWALLFNGSPKPPGNLFTEMDDGLWQAAGAVKAWPQRDLFDQYR
jgi:CubicO group peptidase (beta-lactamase class C family)